MDLCRLPVIVADIKYFLSCIILFVNDLADLCEMKFCGLFWPPKVVAKRARAFRTEESANKRKTLPHYAGNRDEGQELYLGR
jgi:hypothetical protein